MTPKINPVVKTVIEAYPAFIQDKILFLRQLILETAAASEAVGEIEETLKWGEPAYLTSASKSGSTIRLGWSAKTEKYYGLYFNCNTTLVDSFRTLFPGLFNFQGNRAIIFAQDAIIPENELRQCIKMTLRYHLDKKNRKVIQS